MENGEGHILGAGMNTPPHNLFLSWLPAAATQSLAHAVADSGRDFPGVNGAIGTTGPLAETWETRTGHVPARAIDLATGRCWPSDRRRYPRDIELVASWFHAEAQPHAPTGDWRGQAARLIRSGQVHLWGDAGTVVSLGGVSSLLRGGKQSTHNRCTVGKATVQR